MKVTLRCVRLWKKLCKQTILSNSITTRVQSITTLSFAFQEITARGRKYLSKTQKGANLTIPCNRTRVFSIRECHLCTISFGFITLSADKIRIFASIFPFLLKPRLNHFFIYIFFTLTKCDVSCTYWPSWNQCLCFCLGLGCKLTMEGALQYFTTISSTRHRWSRKYN